MIVVAMSLLMAVAMGRVAVTLLPEKLKSACPMPSALHALFATPDLICPCGWGRWVQLSLRSFFLSQTLSHIFVAKGGGGPGLDVPLQSYPSLMAMNNHRHFKQTQHHVTC